MQNFFDNALGFFYVAIFAVIYFPGGTILMALSCNTDRLDGWDWVLSVIIPAYGLFTAIFASPCMDLI